MSRKNLKALYNEVLKYAKRDTVEYTPHPHFDPNGLLSPRVGRVLRSIIQDPKRDLHNDPVGEQALMAYTTGDAHLLPGLGASLHEEGHPAAHAFNWESIPTKLEIDKKVLPHLQHAASQDWVLQRTWGEGSDNFDNTDKLLTMDHIGSDRHLHHLYLNKSHTDLHYIPEQDYRDSLSRLGLYAREKHRDTTPHGQETNDDLAKQGYPVSLPAHKYAMIPSTQQAQNSLMVRVPIPQQVQPKPKQQAPQPAQQQQQQAPVQESMSAQNEEVFKSVGNDAPHAIIMPYYKEEQQSAPTRFKKVVEGLIKYAKRDTQEFTPHPDFDPKGLISPRVGRVLRSIIQDPKIDIHNDPIGELATMAYTTGNAHLLPQLGQELHAAKHPSAHAFNWDNIPQKMWIDKQVLPHMLSSSGHTALLSGTTLPWSARDADTAFQTLTDRDMRYASDSLHLPNKAIKDSRIRLQEHHFDKMGSSHNYIQDLALSDKEGGSIGHKATKYASTKSPEGGMISRGIFYAGGKFVPEVPPQARQGQEAPAPIKVELTKRQKLMQSLKQHFSPIKYAADQTFSLPDGIADKSVGHIQRLLSKDKVTLHDLPQYDNLKEN